MMKLLCAMALVLMAGCATHPLQNSRPISEPDVSAEQKLHEQISYAQWLEQWIDISTRSGALITDEDQFIRVVLQEDHTQYFFTSVIHPAYPATIRRSIVEQGEQLYLQTVGWYVHAKPEFRELFNAFVESNGDIAREIRDRLESESFTE